MLSDRKGTEKSGFQRRLTVEVGRGENIVIIIQAPLVEAVLIRLWVFLPILSSPREEMALLIYIP